MIKTAKQYKEELAGLRAELSAYKLMVVMMQTQLSKRDILFSYKELPQIVLKVTPQNQSGIKLPDDPKEVVSF